MTQKQDILFKELNGWRGTIGAGKGSHGMCVSGDIMDRLPGYLPVPYAQSHGTEKSLGPFQCIRRGLGIRRCVQCIAECFVTPCDFRKSGKFVFCDIFGKRENRSIAAWRVVLIYFCGKTARMAGEVPDLCAKGGINKKCIHCRPKANIPKKNVGEAATRFRLYTQAA